MSSTKYSIIGMICNRAPIISFNSHRLILSNNSLLGGAKHWMLGGEEWRNHLQATPKAITSQQKSIIQRLTKSTSPIQPRARITYGQIKEETLRYSCLTIVVVSFTWLEFNRILHVVVHVLKMSSYFFVECKSFDCPVCVMYWQ